MKELDDFGFRTASSQIDPTGFIFLTEKRHKVSGFHVSDLWSQRQQQEFLRTLRLEKAQNARERHTAFMNFLIQSRKKLFKPSETDQLYERILHEANPETAARWQNAGQKGAVIRQMANQMSLRSSKSGVPSPDVTCSPEVKPGTRHHQRRLSDLDALIDHCQTTLKSFQRSPNVSPMFNMKHRASIV